MEQRTSSAGTTKKKNKKRIYFQLNMPSIWSFDLNSYSIFCISIA